MTTMAERRQLLIEIDRTFKLIAEGLESFDEKWEAMKAAPNKQQKEKHMAELKEELKKLQRYRAKVMAWTTCKEVKDKKAIFEDQRLIIETRMETYRDMERADKTKPFSEKALEAEPKIDPVQRDHEEVFQWLRHTISELQTQMEPWEAELERLMGESSGGRAITAKIEDLRLRISQNEQHVAKIELIMRYLHNDSIEFQDVKDLQETVEAYVESQRDSNCAVDIDYLDIYDDILATVRENDQLLLLPMAQNQAPGALNTATSIDDLEEEQQEPAPANLRQLVSPREMSPVPFPLPHKRASIPIPNLSVEDHGSSHQHHASKNLGQSARQQQNVIIPAPTPPPLSVPYSQVAAAKVQQAAEMDEAVATLARERKEALSPPEPTSTPTSSSPETSEEESSECSNSPDQKLKSPAPILPISNSSKAKRAPSRHGSIIHEIGSDISKTPPPVAELKLSIDGDSSTDDMLSLACDMEKLGQISRRTMPMDVTIPKSGDQDEKHAFNGRKLSLKVHGEDDAPVSINTAAQPKATSIPIASNRGIIQNGSCFKAPGAASFSAFAPLMAPFGVTTSDSDYSIRPPIAAPTHRIPKLPYAFNGATGGSDADDVFRNKGEVLIILDAASKRMPHPDNSMRSGHRRLWREQNFQGALNPNYPIQQNYNFYGVDYSSRAYYAMLSDETLMFVFYYLQGTLAHRYTIECLEERGWMWHTQRMQWFKHESADLIALRQQLEGLDKKNGFVAGSFRYFDIEKWEERSATPDFVFRLDFWKTFHSWDYCSQSRSMPWLKSDNKILVKDN